MKPVADHDAVQLPAPTAWPLVTAFALTLTLAGLVTHVVVSMVGLLLLARGAAGWWHDVLPLERHETVAIAAADLHVSIRQSQRVVDHLRAGTGGHRVKVPAEIHPYSSGLIGGAVGGVAMAIVAVAYGLIEQHSLWYVVNLLAAGVVPSLAAADLNGLRSFSAAGLGVGFVMHGSLSGLMGLLYAVILPMFPRRAGLWSGLVMPIVWSGVVVAILDLVNPTLNSRIDWTWFVVSQLAFGLTCGFVVARTEKIETMQSWTFESRAGLEAPRTEIEE